MCVQITIEDAQAQQWISEIHPDVQLVSNMDSISFFVRVCVSSRSQYHITIPWVPETF